ncbi:reverse transcriptase domain-containing protein [Tanacetum coccineum]
MSTHEQITNNPTSAVRNTGGRNGPQGLEEPMSDEILREICDKNYHQLLPLIAEKMQKEKEQKDKLNAVKAQLIYGEESGVKIRSREESHDSESKTLTAPRRRRGDREGGVFNRLGRKEPTTSARSDSRRRSPQAKRTEVETRRRQQKQTPSRATSQYSESEDSEGGHWKSRSRRQKSNIDEDDLYQPWTFWFDKLPKESIDSYEDLRTAFRENYLQQTKHIKDPVEIHHIKQRDGESTEDFMERYKAEVLDVEGALEALRISVMYVWDNPPGLYQGGGNSSAVARSHGQRKTPSWKPSEGGNKPNFKKGFKNKQRPDRKPDRFSLLTKTPKEIFALEKGKFKAPPPMVTPVEKRDPNKYCEFHSDTGHSTDECMQLRKQIDEMIKAGKLSQFIKELKQNDKPKAPKRGEASGKDKPLTILMIQPWERVAKPRITQSFSPETAMSFPPLREEEGTEGPMIIEVEMGGHFVHRVYVDGGASSEVLYEHCFIKLRKEIRDQMVPATTHLIGFSGETIWPLGQIALLVKIGDEVHSTSAWMNFMVIRSPSQHNAIIGRPGIRKIRAVPSTAHGMLKFPVEGGTVTLQSSRVIPMECAMISGPSIQPPAVSPVLEEKINIAIPPSTSEQTTSGYDGVPTKPRGSTLDILEMDISRLGKNEDEAGPERNKAIQEEDKADAVLSLHIYGGSKGRDKLNGKLASLNRFLSKSAEKSLPFFKTLKNCTKRAIFNGHQKPKRPSSK